MLTRVAFVLILSFASASAYTSVLLGRGTEYPYDLCQGSDGTGCLIVGTSREVGVSDRIELYRLDEDLTTLWSYRSPQINAGVGGYGICNVTSTIPGYQTAEYIEFGYEGFSGNVRLFDDSGMMLGSFLFQLPGHVHCRVKDGVQLRSGDVAVLGETSDNQVFVAVLDKNDLSSVAKSLIYDPIAPAYTYPGCIIETDPWVGDFLLVAVTPLTGPGRVVCMDNRGNSLSAVDFCTTC